MKNYGQYGDIAIEATNRYPQICCPEASWQAVAEDIIGSRKKYRHLTPAQIKDLSSVKKGCPRSAYLGLCQEGMVEGVPGEAYTSSPDNAPHAVAAARLLLEEPKLASQTPVDLWSTVTDRLGIPHTSHQGQMDVLLALWGAGKIVRV